jgi:hypothetical protein
VFSHPFVVVVMGCRLFRYSLQNCTLGSSWIILSGVPLRPESVLGIKELIFQKLVVALVGVEQ